MTAPTSDIAKIAEKLKHQHQFVIPVEWDSTPGLKNHPAFGRKTLWVIKLRCACGEETDR